MWLMRVGEPGSERPAVVTRDGTILDTSSVVEDHDPAFFAEGGLARLTGLLESGTPFPTIDPDRERVGAPLTRPGKVVCIGLNYADHIAEAGMDAPDEPTVFMKSPTAVVGPDDDVLLPPGAEKVDWEVELAVVIGRTARHVGIGEALRYVAGYAISNDVSERAYQLERGGQWVKGKSYDSFNPLGPWIVTTDQVPDPQALTMRLEVNGEARQASSTSHMVFTVAEIVAYLSDFMTLEPGDVINTGTPHGVGMGMSPPRYLREGDVMELSIEGLGRQRQHCRRSHR